MCLSDHQNVSRQFVDGFATQQQFFMDQYPHLNFAASVAALLAALHGLQHAIFATAEYVQLVSFFQDVAHTL